MFKKMLRRWLGIPIDPREHQLHPVPDELRNPISVLGETHPTFMVYRIGNGYVVRVREAETAYNSSSPPKVPAVFFCKNHTEIAERIAAEATRNSLGVQYELFPKP